MLQDAYPLSQASAGRLVVRTVDGGRSLVFGVVEVPVSAPAERMVMARLNSDLWLDLARPLDDPAGTVGACDIDSLLVSLRYRDHALVDALDVFLRRTPMESTHPGHRWDIVAGVAARSLTATPSDGLYEIGPNGLGKVGEESFKGITPGGILRMPMWGPGGQFGLAMSLDPDIYESEMDRIRSRNRRDPEFARFMDRMDSLGQKNGPLVYTAEQAQARQQVVRQVMASLSDEGAHQPRPRPRP